MTIRRMFLSRLLREKVLVVMLLAVGAAIWLSSVSKRVRAAYGEWSRTGSSLEAQNKVLSDADAIKARAAEAIKSFDAAQTLDPVRLSGQIGQIASSAGLTNTTLGDTRTEPTAQFAVHSVQFNVRRAELGTLLKFYDLLAARAPYIGVEQCTLNADRTNPNYLNASMRITAVEVLKGKE